MNNILIIKTLKDNLANILLALLKIINKLNKKIFSLVNVLDKSKDIFTF